MDVSANGIVAPVPGVLQLENVEKRVQVAVNIAIIGVKLRMLCRCGVCLMFLFFSFSVVAVLQVGKM